MNKIRTAFAALGDKNTLLLLRVPFSYYLFPVFLFGISQATNIHAIKLFIVLIAQHFFIYPGSNIYNSYMDKDEGAIGGLESPPPVTREMYYVSIIFDLCGLLLCSLAGWTHVLVMLGYIAFSKSYSWYGIRFKKYPLLGWLSVMFFQGGYTFMQGNMAAEDMVSLDWFTTQHIEAMLFASLIIGGSYPLTQVYQHKEDGERGDFTISYKLGVKGTFLFSSIFFLAGTFVALHYFCTYYSFTQFLVYFICTIPVTTYFSSWFRKILKNNANADYKHTMRMTQISATCTIICFIIITYLNKASF